MKNDGKLIRLLKEKNESAFKEVYYQYYKLIFYVAYSILNNKEDAEDVSQTTFIKFMKNIDAIDDNTNIKQLLSSICKNEAIDQYRRNANKYTSYNDEVTNEVVEKKNDDFDVIITLNDVLEKKEAHIAILKIVYNFSFQEIADDLNESLGTIQAIYYKAISKLKNYYKENII